MNQKANKRLENMFDFSIDKHSFV